MKTSAPSTPNVCYLYGEVGHYANHCPRKQNQLTPQGQHSNQKGTPQKPSPNTGKVNHVSTKMALAEPEVMLGTFDVNSTPASVLLILELRFHSYHKHLLECIAYPYVPCKIPY